jgi:hypothetical protein
VVFTSGIVDEELVVVAGVSQYCLLSFGGAGVEPGASVAGAGPDTLLSFEESGDWSSECLLGPHVPVRGCVAVVGVLFVNWIVDASICDSPVHHGVVTF